MDFSDVMNRLNTEDRFSAVNDMKLVTVNEGFAEAELAVSDNSMNSLNVIQGGAIYTLADFAFSGAANANRAQRSLPPTAYRFAPGEFTAGRNGCGLQTTFRVVER